MPIDKWYVRACIHSINHFYLIHGVSLKLNTFLPPLWRHFRKKNLNRIFNFGRFLAKIILWMFFFFCFVLTFNSIIMSQLYANGITQSCAKIKLGHHLLQKNTSFLNMLSDFINFFYNKLCQNIIGMILAYLIFKWVVP